MDPIPARTNIMMYAISAITNTITAIIHACSAFLGFVSRHISQAIKQLMVKIGKLKWLQECLILPRFPLVGLHPF